jgi:Fe-S-cluster-containing dehydrogenase component
VHACPFGVPKLDFEELLQYKCNLCYDRTSQGLGPMCATVCPTGSIWYGTLEELERERPGVRVSDVFEFGETAVQTGVGVVVSSDYAGDATPAVRDGSAAPADA